MNQLFPVFLQDNRLNILIVGGGAIAKEKTDKILRSSPDAGITILSKTIDNDFSSFLCHHPQIRILVKKFEANDVAGYQLILAATDNRALNEEIAMAAKNKNILFNAADMPNICDFFLGAEVRKGALLMAISTNGKSPLIAVRLREYFEQILPEELDDVIRFLHAYRETLKSDFDTKIKKLRALTAVLEPGTTDSFS